MTSQHDYLERLGHELDHGWTIFFQFGELLLKEKNILFCPFCLNDSTLKDQEVLMNINQTKKENAESECLNVSVRASQLIVPPPRTNRPTPEICLRTIVSRNS